MPPDSMPSVMAAECSGCMSAEGSDENMLVLRREEATAAGSSGGDSVGLDDGCLILPSTKRRMLKALKASTDPSARPSQISRVFSRQLTISARCSGVQQDMHCESWRSRGRS